MIVLTTLGPLVLLILCTVFFMRRHGKKQRQKQRLAFEAACAKRGFQLQYLLQRPDSIAALHTHGGEMAWADSNDAAAVHFYPLKKTGEPILHIKRARQQIQKITLQPPYANGAKNAPDIVFYDELRDRESLLDAAVAESKKWEQAIRM